MRWHGMTYPEHNQSGEIIQYTVLHVAARKPPMSKITGYFVHKKNLKTPAFAASYSHAVSLLNRSVVNAIRHGRGGHIEVLL